MDGRVSAVLDLPPDSVPATVSVHTDEEMRILREGWKKAGAGEERQRLNAEERSKGVHKDLVQKLKAACDALNLIREMQERMCIDEILAKIEE